MEYKYTILVCVHSQTDFHDGLLNNALKSLEDQTFKNFNTVIVLDQCWDNTIKNIKPPSNHTIYQRDRKEGLAFAKNFGLSKIDSEWVGFLDADDYYLPEKMEKQIAYIENNDVDFLGTLAYDKLWRDGKKIVPSCYEPGRFSTHEKISAGIQKENMMCHGSMLIKKKCLDALGSYEHHVGHEDWDLWKRAIAAGYKFANLDERLYVWSCGTSVDR